LTTRPFYAGILSAELPIKHGNNQLLPKAGAYIPPYLAFFINCHAASPRSSSHRRADLSNMIVYITLHRWRGVTRMVELTKSRLTHSRSTLQDSGAASGVR